MGSSPAPPATRRYRVRIHYREPGYEARTCRRLHPYVGAFEVDACTEKHAIKAAVEEFKRFARQSSVGWERQIVEIECERVAM